MDEYLLYDRQILFFPLNFSSHPLQLKIEEISSSQLLHGMSLVESLIGDRAGAALTVTDGMAQPPKMKIFHAQPPNMTTSCDFQGFFLLWCRGGKQTNNAEKIPKPNVIGLTFAKEDV